MTAPRQILEILASDTNNEVLSPKIRLKAAKALLKSDTKLAFKQLSRPAVSGIKVPAWYEIKLMDLTMFFLKVVVAVLPAVALSFLIYMLTVLSVLTITGLLR